MALQRYWYLDRGQGGRNRLAVVEKSNASTTKETITSNFSSVSEVKDLRIYTIDCIGEQETFEDILLKKKDAFKNVKKSDTKYEKWFLKYIPK